MMDRTAKAREIANAQAVERARLFAAAPELLEALREILRCPASFIGDGQFRITIDSATYKLAIESLAKAKGA